MCNQAIKQPKHFTTSGDTGGGGTPFEPSQKEMSVPPKIFILQKSTLTVNDPLQYQNYLLSLHQLSKQATRAYISPPGFVGSFFINQNKGLWQILRALKELSADFAQA